MNGKAAHHKINNLMISLTVIWFCLDHQWGPAIDKQKLAKVTKSIWS